MRALIVLGSASAATQYAIALRQAGHAVDHVTSITEAREAISVSAYDLLITDLDQTRDEAIDFLKSLRTAKSNVSFLVFASRECLDLVTVAIDKGANEFILKPFDIEELKIRVGYLAALRTPTAPESDRLIVEAGPLKVDMASRQIWLNGELMELTPRERGVLQVLFRHRGNVVSKEYIASRVFSMEDEATPTSIETYIHRLRRKTGTADVAIKTVRGLGYILETGEAAAGRS